MTTMPPFSDVTNAKLAKFPRTAAFLGGVIQKNPLQKSFLQQSVSSLLLPEAEAFEKLLGYYANQQLADAYLVDSYNLLAMDTVREQLHFKKHGKYRYDSFAQVEKSVYLNAEYMTKYMYGLAISLFLWPNHREILAWYASRLPKHKGGRFLEVGPGHGLFFLRALQETHFDSYEALDLSPSSIEMTRKLVTSGYFGHYPKVDFRVADFFTAPLSESYDGIVMGEVLEHVERPEQFLEGLHRIAKRDAFIYLTTVVNTPAIDHISLFKTTDEVWNLLRENGFEICDSLAVPYQGMDLAACAAQKLPISLAYVLRKLEH